jgi:hypothetical protein
LLAILDANLLKLLFLVMDERNFCAVGEDLMVARLVESVSPPQKAVAVMEATSPISHKKPALSSAAGLLAKLIIVLKICCVVSFVDRFSRFTSVDEEVAGLFTLLMSSIAFASIMLPW